MASALIGRPSRRRGGREAGSTANIVATAGFNQTAATFGNVCTSHRWGKQAAQVWRRRFRSCSGAPATPRSKSAKSAKDRIESQREDSSWTSPGGRNARGARPARDPGRARSVSVAGASRHTGPASPTPIAKKINTPPDPANLQISDLLLIQQSKDQGGHRLSLADQQLLAASTTSCRRSLCTTSSNRVDIKGP